ncbi:MAG TPA: carboxymuconolactone decarboxylase family protein [Trebonia sp.]|nr:carboxymuconolactone decarboxylase family protein [Trebonia sp.]
MALVPLPEKQNMDPADLPAIETGLAAFGHMLHTWQAVANVPGLFSQYFPYLRTLTGPGPLDQRIKELTAVQVAILNHCRYTVSHRCFSAQGKGVTEAELVKIAANDLQSFSEAERLALEFTRAVTLDVPATTAAESATGIDEALRERVREAFEPEQLVELLMSVSLWNAIARFHRILDLDPDLPAAPAGVDALL